MFLVIRILGFPFSRFESNPLQRRGYRAMLQRTRSAAKVDRDEGGDEEEEEEEEGALELDDCKRQIAKNLLLLERQGLAARRDGFAAVAAAVGAEVAEAKRVRAERRREYFR